MPSSKTIRFSIQLVALIFVASLASVSMAATDTAAQVFNLGTDDIAVLGVSGNPSTITIVAPGTGGDTPANPSDSSSYANYTSTVADGLTRVITAEFGAAEASLTGTHLTLLASEASGTEGTATSAITVSSSAQNIVTGIGSCATGATGTMLTYTVVIDDVTALVAGESKTINMLLSLLEDA